MAVCNDTELRSLFKTLQLPCHEIDRSIIETNPEWVRMTAAKESSWKISSLEIKMDTDFRDIDDWDSLTALGVISMIDDEYNVKVSGEELKSSKSVRDIFNIVKTKVG
jgi:acyl carrier protein